MTKASKYKVPQRTAASSMFTAFGCCTGCEPALALGRQLPPKGKPHDRLKDQTIKAWFSHWRRNTFYPESAAG